MKNPTRSCLSNNHPASNYILGNDFCCGVEKEENLPDVVFGNFQGPQSRIFKNTSYLNPALSDISRDFAYDV
jgi:hypothetical protein